MKNKLRYSMLLLALVLSSTAFSQGIRMHYEEMTDNERDDLMDAYSSLGGSSGTTGLVNDIATFHVANFGEIHFNVAADDVFLAWHRQASHEMERAVKEDRGNEWVTIPYWDWTISNSESDALWDNVWLGQFNDNWNLNRQFDNDWNSPNAPLPSQGNINTSLLEDNFFQFSRVVVEDGIIHSGGHVWLGGNPPDGVMAGANSPKDPAFFFHHNMVDKIWADWHELNGPNTSNFYIKTDMPRYPNVDPESIVDPRALGIFYAENGLATLDQYIVNNIFADSEKYGYRYDIEAKDGFIIPDGNDAEFRSCRSVLLGTGFLADKGGTFLASIDGDCNFSTEGFKGEDEDNEIAQRNSYPNSGEVNQSIAGSDLSIKNFPNPFSESTTFEIQLKERTNVRLDLVDLSGRLVKRIIDNELMDSGTHQIELTASQLQSGIYFYKFSTDKKTLTGKVILEK